MLYSLRLKALRCQQLYDDIDFFFHAINNSP